MKKISEFIVKQKYLFLGIFFVLLIGSAVAYNFVKVNYDLTEYLPDSTSTKQSILTMQEEFGASGSASIMITNISKENADILAKQIEENETIKNYIATATVVQWKEAEVDGKTQPCALINIFLKNGDYTQEAEHAINGIKEILSTNLDDSQNYYCTGSAISALSSRTAISNEIPIILLIAIAIVLLILLFTTRSWIEPVILLIVIGSAIIINYGTNILLGEISFISNSISAVLLIALAMDYSIVLVSRFREEREKTDNVYDAMKKALAGSMTTIIASGCTVMAGLISLVFMDYKIGFDMGLVLTKGVFISILAVIFLMPAILILFSKIIKKTEHKNFLSGVKSIGTFSYKTRWIIPCIFLVLIVSAGVVQFTSLKFDYVAKFGGTASQIVVDEEKTKGVFGTQNALVVMLDKNLSPETQMEVFEHIKNIEVNNTKPINLANSFMSTGTETVKLGSNLNAQYISAMFGVTQDQAQQVIVMVKGDASATLIYAYELIEGIANPQTQSQQLLHTYIEAMPQKEQIFATVNTFNAVKLKANSLFNGQTQTRFIYNLNAVVDSDEAIQFINTLDEYLQSINQTYYIVNNTQNVIETDSVFSTDRLKVELISIFAILLIVLIAFRKITVPVLLVVLIQGALWVNLAGNAILGNSIFFLCYLLGTAIQMGATIDYGILLTDRYVEARKKQNKKEAIKTAIDKSFVTIISSGTILTLAAYTIGIFSSVPLISSIGFLVGTGALCALITMLFVLPQSLLIFDKLIIKKNKNKSNNNEVIEVEKSDNGKKQKKVLKNSHKKTLSKN